MAEFPHVEIVVHDIGHELLERKLRDDEVEFAISGLPDRKEADLRYEVFANYVVSAIQPRRGGEDDQPLTWAEVLGQRTIGIHRGSGIRELIDHKLLEHHLEFTPSFEVQFLSTALAMTAAGLGTAILPAYVLPGHLYPGLSVRPLVEPEISRPLMVVTRPGRTLSAAAEAFIALARAHLLRHLPGTATGANDVQ
jgi:DNA-binding transcriptional LysR family regulator